MQASNERTKYTYCEYVQFNLELWLMLSKITDLVARTC